MQRTRGGDHVQEDGALDGEERAELERLRTEVEHLRSQTRTGNQASAEATGPDRRAGRWRAVAATLLIVLGCMLAPLTVMAVWLRNQVTDTDRYVATVAPLADDPAIQDAVADQITNLVSTAVDVEELTVQAVDALAGRGLNPRLAEALRSLAGPAADGVHSFIRTEVGKVVASDAFADAWRQANRIAHDRLVAVMTGEGGGAVTVEDDTVSLNLAAFIQTVKQRLVASGFGLASRIPDVDASFVLFQSADIARAQAGFNLLTMLGDWLPLLVLVLLAVGVSVAGNHRRALVGAGLGVAGGMVVLAMVLVVFRAMYLDGIPDEVLPDDAAAALYDTVVRFLQAGLRTVLVLALVVAGGAFLSGQSVTAVRTRAGVTAAIAWLRGGAGHAGPLSTWVYTNKQALRVGAVVLGVVALVFWDRPTGRVIVGLTGVLLLALALIEFLGRPPPGRDPVPRHAG